MGQVNLNIVCRVCPGLEEYHTTLQASIFRIQLINVQNTWSQSKLVQSKLDPASKCTAVDSVPELIQGRNNHTVNRFYQVTTWTLEELDCMWDMPTVDPL